MFHLRFDADTEEFLEALDPSTRKIYSYGLAAFQTFYKPQGSIKDFLDRVEEDLHKPRRIRKRVARNTLKGFVEWLQKKGYKPKTIRAYVAAVQSEAKYFDVPISIRYVKMPAAHPVSKKFPWTIEKIAEFVDSMKKPIYKSIAVSIVQSGLSISDLLSLRYQDIKEEFEAGIEPLCLDLARIKTDVPFLTFLGSWAVSMLKQHLKDQQLKPQEPIYKISARAVQRYFQRAGRKFVGEYEGNCPVRPHSLRAAFHTILSDHKVDPLYIEFWMGHQVPEQQRVYISKSREGWRKTYREQAEPWLTPFKIENYNVAFKEENCNVTKF